MTGRTTATTYCRICAAGCGILVDLEGDVVSSVRGDRDHPLTRGFTCPKGRRIAELHADPGRYRTSMRRDGSGRLVPVDVGRAMDDIAARMGDLVDRWGPESVAMLSGTQSSTATLTNAFSRAWFRALGSPKQFSTMSIDQSAKWVREARLGRWEAGRQRFEDSDVWLLAGTNPLVSMQGGELWGFPVHDPVVRLREARRHGLRLIVIDPRRTETAGHADLHLQPQPGTDALVFAGLIHVVLAERLADLPFCRDHVRGLDALRRATDPMTPEAVAPRCGLAPDELVEAGRMFGSARRGMASTGTGTDMGPWPNLAEHLVGALNAICGRHPRAGDAHAHGGVLKPVPMARARVVPPARTWERGHRGATGYGQVMGELPSATLADEILRDGDERIRALVVVGSNPAASFPDQHHTLEALSALELLVTVEPFPTETAALADYVIAPTMALERADHTGPLGHVITEPFGQYTEPVLSRPPGVVEDWELFTGLAARMGLTLRIGSREFPPGVELDAEALLASLADKARVPLAEVRRHPHGHLFPDAPIGVVQPAGAGREGDDVRRFDVAPDDVVAELASAWGAAPPARPDRPFRLVVRRSKSTMNTLGRRLPGLVGDPPNPCFLHPDDLAELGAGPGGEAVVRSDHGTVRAILRADDTLRRGVASMTHCFGGLPGTDDDPAVVGSNPARLLSTRSGLATISAMPLMSAVPVAVEPAPSGPAAAPTPTPEDP